MKRLQLFAAMLLCSLMTFGQYSGSGNGTEEDPYLIFNETQLSQMSNFPNQEGVVFKLMKDLDLSAWIEENNPSQGWLPIGVESAPFMGILYGNNKTIRGLKISRTSSNNVGFFGYVSGATITNLTIEGSTIDGADNVGGFAGYIISSEISNCHVTLTGINGSSCVGAFAGYSAGTSYTSFSASAVVEASNMTGGFIGDVATGSFTGGQIITTVTGAGNYTGGLFGKATDFTLSNIKVSGDVTGQDMVGGIIGSCSNGTFTDCTYTGALTGNESVGGIAGVLESVASAFTNCFSKGKISATSNYCGGIAGVSQGGCIEQMENCSHFGDINGMSYVGGLIGAILNTVEPPVLHTYESIDVDNNSHVNWYYETINTGTFVVKNINNCTAVGYLCGSTNIGGLIGSETTANGYTSSANLTNKDTYRHKYYYYVGDNQMASWTTKTCPIYDESSTQVGWAGTFTYNTYTRNTISLSLTNSYFSGTIQGTVNVGGLYGYKSGGIIQNNYSCANIFGTSNVGGITGYISDERIEDTFVTTTIKTNISNNTIISATSANIGRIYGWSDSAHVIIGDLGSTEGNRGLTRTKLILQGVVQDIEDDLQQGTSIGPSLLRLKATYVSMGWDFDANWEIQETECYPYKKYQAAPPVIESELVSQATSIAGKSIDGGTVYLYYKSRDAVSTGCDGHQWEFATEPLQSGAQVQIYADVEGMTPSYFTSTFVGYPGNGTEDDPYRIYTAEDLQGACNLGYYKVMNDIDLTAWINENSPEKGWTAIGRNSGEVTYIDGDGHKISGLWINAPDEDFTGLFSNFSAGQIKNLNVEVAAGKKVLGGDYTGVLIGRNANGTIENCTVTGDVEGTAHIGGVTGYAEATTISAASYEGSVSSNAEGANVGGIAGQMKNCTVSSCNAVPTIATNGTENHVGGLAGYAEGGSITESIADATINVTGADSQVGGFVGYSQTPITLSASSGNVTATGESSNTGGLVGYALSPIENSYSTATTIGTEFTAGLVGYTFSTIDKCYAKGDVYGVIYGGGIVGELDGAAAAITNSVACNNILSLSAQSSWGSRVIGGFKNGAADPDESNYALSTMQVSLNNVPQIKTDDIVEGQARTQEQLMQSATYVGLGWDFTDIWGVEEGVSYPKLKWEGTITPTPSDLVMGDANGDNIVNVTDYMMVANYILGHNVENFNVTAADVNEDNDVNVSDYVGVANIILYGNYTGSSANSIKARTAEGSSAWMEVSEAEDGNLNLLLHNAKTFSAFQMDINLPAGVEIVEATMAKSNQTRNLGMARLNDGTYRLLYGTLENKAISLVDDGLLTIVLKRNSRVNGVVYIDNIILTHKDASSVRLSGVQTPMVTGIDMVDSETKAGVYYDLSGRRVANRPLKKGVYIVNGEKMLVK